MVVKRRHGEPLGASGLSGPALRESAFQTPGVVAGRACVVLREGSAIIPSSVVPKPIKAPARAPTKVGIRAAPIGPLP